MNKQTTRKALKPAYRKHKLLRKDVNAFIDELSACLKTIQLSEERDEHEEHYKEPIKTFLKNTFYTENYINTKDRIDLAIYTGKDANSDVAVIIEAKRPSNKAEFLAPKSLNHKALQELLLYYLRERIENDNNNIKHLIATNGYEWFLFKSDDFYEYFYKNKALLKEYETFRDGNKDSSKNELFYNEIAKKYIAKVENELPFVYLNFTKVNVREYSDADLNTLYKIFSDVHILGTSFGNDSNQLNKAFYNELLHIIGLEEVKQKGKKIISRKAENKRDYASILESAIFVLEDRDYLQNIKSIESGINKAFYAGLELSLTWINRILFIKLLESQLLGYHNGAKNYRFLNSDFIKGYDDLNDLFFSALAKKHKERHPKYKERFKYIPYLNSSLFERDKLENEAFTISALNNDKITIFSQTVLKDNSGKRLTGKLRTLQYLFLFLDAYDFSADGNEGIEDGHETKTLINASVLGLIFEKINGYKEGSFYTPAYITMYMSREILRRAVVQKFKDTENEQIENYDDLKAYTRKFFKKNDIQRFNNTINSIKIIDPAVGSGHFLVSALNELISIKSDLGILIDGKGLPLQTEIVIDNDELYITDKYGHLLDYKPDVKETAIIQKSLFHEKQNLIENSLFGVDINPNSVKICRLRLWIELLKNAYYSDDNRLQTLPNIDINIKAGNSLVSRFSIDDKNSKLVNGARQKLRLATDKYKQQVVIYKNTTDNRTKQNAIKEISRLKEVFSQIANPTDKDYSEIKKMKAEIGEMPMFFSQEEQKNWLNQLKIKTVRLKKLEEAYNKKMQTLYRNAFEWRFEFPEVLDSNGNFIGFDVVIGNPPYIKEYEGKEIFDGLRNLPCYQGKMDIWYLFGCLGAQISVKDKGLLSFIATNNWITNSGASKFRNYIASNTQLLQFVDFSNFMVFAEASVQTMTMIYKNRLPEKEYIIDYRKIISRKPKIKDLKDILAKNKSENVKYFDFNFNKDNFIDKPFTFNSPLIKKVLEKIFAKGNYYLDEKEVANGIHPHHDYVNNKMQGLLSSRIKIGAGIFALSDKEKEKLNLNEQEEKLIKPYYSSKNFSKYYGKPTNTEWIIYTGSEFKKKENIKPYPNIKKHLDRFKKVITSDNKPYGLHRARKEDFFKGEKIIVQRKCPTEPIFTYTDFDCYVSATFYVIKTNQLNQKYLTAILNSKLIAFWLKYKGKMQGTNYQIDKEPIVNIPLIEIPKNQETKFTAKVNKILKLKETNADTSQLEAEINKMVYKLYELTDGEIKIIEGSVK